MQSNKLVPILLILFSSLSFAEPVWIDVRSAFEHAIDNIEGDLRVPYDEVVETLTPLYPNKDTEINLYCRSGNRSGKALHLLREAGYTNIKNAGGIDDARRLREIK